MPTKVCLVKAIFFPVVMHGCESWTIKKAERWRTDAFELWFWRTLLRVLWTARSTQSILKEISPEYSLEGLMLKLKLQDFGHQMSWLIGKVPDAGKNWRQEKGTTEDEIVGWHHGLDGHEFEQAPGTGDGQGGLACCSPWGQKCRTWLGDWPELREYSVPFLVHFWKNCNLYPLYIDLVKIASYLAKTSSTYLQNYIAPERSVTRGTLSRSESYYLDMHTEMSHYPPCFSASVIKTQDGLVASFSSSSAHTVSHGVWTVTPGSQDMSLRWRGESSVWGVCVWEREGERGWVKGQRRLTKRTVGDSSR